MAVITGIKLLLDDAENDLQRSKMNPGGALSAALGSAISSLTDSYGASDGGSPGSLGGAIDDGSEYAKMFADVAKGFSSLFDELGSMRSSYLPSELAQESIGSDGGAITLEQAVEAESILESYENAFFRMLGMPSSSDINTNQSLVSVDNKGVFLKQEMALTPDRYMAVLDTRQLSTTSRPGAPTNAIYDFLSSSISPLTRLEKAGFSYMSEIQEITNNMSRLFGAAQVSPETEQYADQILATASSEPAPGDSSFDSNRDGMNALLEGFRMSSDNDAAAAMAAFEASIVSLTEVLRLSLLMLEPNLYNKYTIDLRSSLWDKEVAKVQDASMQGFTTSANFWKFSYLLFPPIQDGRIAKCINEPKRMVAPPFLPKSHRVVNGHTMRSTLLEAVIRIRLDTLAGTTISNASGSTGDAQLPVTVGTSDVPITYRDIEDSRGLIESLIVTRLFSALYGLAIDVSVKIQDLSKLQHKTGYSPSEGAPITDEGSRTDNERKDYCDEGSPIEPGSRCQLETMKTIEESILLILGDDSTPSVLEVQEGQVRGSGLRSAHLMSAVLSVLDVPRKWVSKQIAEADEEDARIADKAADEIQSKISEKVGLSKGVGAIDLLAFIIAFFTAKETTLLSLLTEEQFSNLKMEFPSGFFDTSLRMDTQAKAVDDISIRAFDAYQLFRYAVGEPRAPFGGPLETEDGEPL